MDWSAANVRCSDAAMTAGDVATHERWRSIEGRSSVVVLCVPWSFLLAAGRAMTVHLHRLFSSSIELSLSQGLSGLVVVGSTSAVYRSRSFGSYLWSSLTVLLE